MEGKKTHFKFSPRTDLALEVQESMQEEITDGVDVSTDENDVSIITTVKISTDTASEKMGKPRGTYITIESPLMKENDVSSHEEIISQIAKSINSLAKIDENSSVLVIGLGNWNVTPDALGPKVVSKVLVTRHIFDTLPEELSGGVNSLAAVSPGVMGITGIETQEIVKGIANKVNPDLIIAVDALAARKTSRINATIQMSDAGISPGAGVGNKRKELSKNTLGIPVIAIGIPTVVDAATLVNDAMDRILDDMIKASDESMGFYSTLKALEDEEKYDLIYNILSPYEENMFVTPKEVDEVITRLSNIVANGINIAVHQGIHLEDMNKFIS